MDFKHVTGYSAFPLNFFHAHGHQMFMNMKTDDNDIKTKLKKLEQELSALKKENAQLKENITLDSYLLNVLMDNIPDSIYFKNTKSQFIRITTAMARKFGLDSSEDAVGKTDFDFFSRQHAEQAFIDEQKIINSGKSLINIEEMETWLDGPPTWVSTTKMCIKNQQGDTIGTFGISRDITYRKIMENALKASESKYKELYDEAPVGYHQIDLTGKIIRVNQTEANLLGYSVEEMAGKSMLDYIIPKQRKLAESEIIEKINQLTNPSSTEWKYISKEGKEIDVYLSSRLCIDENGKASGALITIQDITDKKMAQEKLKISTRQLRHAMRNLKRSNAELEQFAYIASHDLQEPLRMISGYLQLLSRRYKEKLDSNADEFIAFAVDGANRMRDLINDLLIYSRVDTKGKTFVTTDCNAVLNIVLAHLKMAIEENNACVETCLLPVIWADSSQMIQLFQNLISNAIKFKGRRKPVIKIGAEQRDCEWCFFVQDNGIGIDPAFNDRIFMIFQRLHTREEYQGTGIGLSVCKKIVERHKGKIWVESSPGEGAAFFFTIPDKNLKTCPKKEFKR